MKLRKCILLAAFPLLLTACGDEKKVNMNISGVHSAVVDTVITLPASPTQALNPAWVDEFGKNLAQYHSVYWEDSFDIVNDNQTVNVKIDAKTNIFDKNADKLFTIREYKYTNEDKAIITQAYLGDGPYYLIGGTEEDNLNPKSYYDEQIEATNKLLELLNSKLIELEAQPDKENEITHYSVQIDSCKSLIDKYKKRRELAPNEWLKADNFDYDEYFVFASDGVSKIHIKFCEAYGSDLISFEVLYPLGKNMENSSTEEHQVVANELLAKLNLPPTTLSISFPHPDIDGTKEITYCEAANIYDASGENFYVQQGNPMYTFIFRKDTVKLAVIRPVEIISQTDAIELLPLDEIKKIAKPYLEQKIKTLQFETDPTLFSYQVEHELIPEFIQYNGLFPLENNQIVINRMALTLQHVFDEGYIGPVWIIFADAKKNFRKKLPIIALNAIDGSLIDDKMLPGLD